MENKEAKRISLPVRLSIICIMVYVFFNCNSILNYCMLGAGFLFILIELLIVKKKIAIAKTNINILVLVIIIFSSISLFITPEIDQGIRFIILFIYIFLYFNVLIIETNSYLFLLTIIGFFSSIHVILTLFQVMFPDIIDLFNSIYLSSSAYLINHQLLSFGYYCGISNQNHMNAFYISVFLCSIISLNLINTNHKNNKPKKLICSSILLIFGIIALIATQKRGILIADVIALISTILLYLINNKNKKEVIRFIVILFGIFVAGWIVIESTTIGKLMQLRFINNNYAEDFSSGRFDLYSFIFNSILGNFIFGNGVGATYSITPNGAHNIYLQLTNDFGLLGTLIFLTLFILFLKKTINTYNKCKNGALIFSFYLQILFVIYGLIGNPLFDNFIFFAYILGCSIPYNLTNKKENISENRYLNLSSGR